MNTSKRKWFDPIIEGCIILAIVTMVAIFAVYFSLETMVVLILLFGVWSFDGALKSYFGIDLDTMFSDLSLSALVFVAGQGAAVILSSGNEFIAEKIIRSGILIFIIGFLWIGNLSMCRSYKSIKTKKSQTQNDRKTSRVYLFFSAVFGIISALIAIIPHIIGMV